METISFKELQVFMLIGVFLLGSETFMIGVAILVTRAWGKEVKAITRQTTQLAQKGLAEDISGLVGNASALLNTVNEITRTQNGIGVSLIISGALLMVASFWFVLNMF